MGQADWIAVDWGTTRLRAWVFNADGASVALSSEDGMGGLEVSGFEPALLALVGAHLPEGRATPVICCGMAGARQGWCEAPYAMVPCTPTGIAQAARPLVRDPRLAVHILPGVAQDAPPDVMRGEETQIAGYLGLNPQFDGVICLPGTHTKWAHVSAGEIVSFRSFMTGEMFALLSEKSVLRHGLGGEDWDDEAFGAALEDALSRPQGLAAELFSLRAGLLLHGLGAGAARARLSGLLIGAELAAARPYWLGQEVAVIGAPALARLYVTALSGQGVQTRTCDVTEATLAGLKAAHAALTAAG